MCVRMCVCVCVSITDDYPKPSAFVCDFTNSVAARTSASDLFIHVNPILNGWLQSFLFTVLNEELLLLFKAATVCVFFFFNSVLFLPQNWAAERGEFNLYEKTPALCKSTVQYKAALPISPPLPSFTPQHLKDCSFSGSALEHTFCSLITHLSACLLQLDKVHENAFCRPVPSCIIKKKKTLIV